MPNVSITLKAGHVGRPEVIAKIKDAGIEFVNDPNNCLGFVEGITDKTEDEIRANLKDIFAISNIIYIARYKLEKEAMIGDFVGMTEADAIAAIQKKGWLYHVIGRDGHKCSWPKDHMDFKNKPQNESRVHLIIEDGKVIKSNHEHPFFKPK